MIVAVANLKGGVGKTVTAVHLAEVAAEQTGSALLVDADPQGSAMAWADAAAGETGGLRSIAVALATPDIERRLQGIASGYDHVVIDTGPGSLDIVTAAIRACTVVVIPSRPTMLDLDRVQTTLQVAVACARPAAVLLTNGRTGTRSLGAAKDALDAAEMPVLATVIPQREAIASSYGTRPQGEAMALYADVWDALDAALKET